MKELSKKVTDSLYPANPTDVAKRLDSALTAISEMGVTFQVWNRSHSDFTWNLMNLDHVGETRNLRQIGAEIKRKRDALVEVHFAYKENLAQSESYKRQAERAEFDDESNLLMVKADKEMAYAQMKHESILGATKDVEALRSAYDKILARIIEKHGKFDESIFEIEEREYWIKRFAIQAMRDVRECGSIRTGAQRDLEQLGIDPMEMLYQIQGFLKYVCEKLSSKEAVVTEEDRDIFLNKVVKRHIEKVEEKLSKMGSATGHWYKEE